MQKPCHDRLSSVRRVFLSAWLLIGCLSLATTVMAAPSTFFGEDLGLGESTPQPNHPNADAARASFLSQLSGVGTETLESYAGGTGAPLAITFPSNPPIIATLNGDGFIGDVPPGSTNGFGRYGTSGSKFWDAQSTFSIDFSSPVAAFGFYGIDIGDFNGQVTLTLTDGSVVLLTVPNTIGAPGGSVLYFGFIDTQDQYISISFGNTAAGVDGFAFDDFTVGSLQQVGQISLAPDSATNCARQTHTVTATVQNSSGPLPNQQVIFTVFSGPNTGTSGTCSSNAACLTDANGQVSFTYVGAGGVGTDSISASFTDSSGVHTSQSVTKTWIQCNRPPDCGAAVACESVLWPPNHKYHLVQICGVTDPDSGDVVAISVTSITQDEPVNARGDGNTCPDAQIVDGQGSVRAERTGTPGVPGNGRVYRINFTASDGTDSCSGYVTVCVPHDQGDPTCVDDGQRYNSLGPCTSGNELRAEAVSLEVAGVTTSGARLSFALPTDGPVDISAFDVAGRRLETIEHGQLAKGAYDRTWDMRGVSRGFYFVRLQASGVIVTKSVIKVR